MWWENSVKDHLKGKLKGNLESCEFKVEFHSKRLVHLVHQVHRNNKTPKRKLNNIVYAVQYSEECL